MQDWPPDPCLNKGGKMLEGLKVRWCRAFHHRTSWPIHGRYACLECGRKFTVPWEPDTEKPEGSLQVSRVGPMRLSRSALEARPS